MPLSLEIKKNDLKKDFSGIALLCFLIFTIPVKSLHPHVEMLPKNEPALNTLMLSLTLLMR